MAVLQLYCFGEEFLADLALEFGEVVGGGDVVHLSFDFIVDPSGETAGVDELAAALAIAGVDERVRLGGLIT